MTEKQIEIDIGRLRKVLSDDIELLGKVDELESIAYAGIKNRKRYLRFISPTGFGRDIKDWVISIKLLNKLLTANPNHASDERIRGFTSTNELFKSNITHPHNQNDIKIETAVNNVVLQTDHVFTSFVRIIIYEKIISTLILASLAIATIILFRTQLNTTETTRTSQDRLNALITITTGTCQCDPEGIEKPKSGAGKENRCLHEICDLSVIDGRCSADFGVKTRTLSFKTLFGTKSSYQESSNSDLSNFYLDQLDLSEYPLSNRVLNGVFLKDNSLEIVDPTPDKNIINLTGTSLRGATVEIRNTPIDFSKSDLSCANLKKTQIAGSIFQGAVYSPSTAFPENFSPEKHNMILKNDPGL